MKAITTLFIALFFGIVSIAAFAQAAEVVKLTSRTFDKEVLNSDAVWIVGFFADWCGHCKRFKPHFIKAAEALGGVVKFGEVNGDEERELMGRYQVQGFPTVKVFPAFKENKKRGVKDYQGARTARAVADYVANELPSKPVLRLTESNLDKFNDNDQPRAVFFTEKASIPSLLKGLALEFNKKMQVAIVSSKEKKVTQHFNVDKFPSVVVVDSESKVHQYEGAIKYKELVKFFGKFTSSSKNNDKSASADSSNKQKTTSGSTSSGKFVLRDMKKDSSLADTCGKKICVIGFVKEKEHRDLMESLANKYIKDKAVRIIRADVEQNAEAAQALNVSQQPAMVIHKVRGNKVAVLEGDFNQENTSNLIDRAIGGDLRFQRLLDVKPESQDNHDEL